MAHSTNFNSKVPETEAGNSPDTRRPPGSFHDGGAVKRQGLITIASSNDLARTQGVRTPQSAEPETAPEDPFAGLPPPVTPLEAKRVWEQHRRPSARSVAKALTRAGQPIHFATVARWKKREWQVEVRLEQFHNRKIVLDERRWGGARLVTDIDLTSKPRRRRPLGRLRGRWRRKRRRNHARAA